MWRRGCSKKTPLMALSWFPSGRPRDPGLPRPEGKKEGKGGPAPHQVTIHVGLRHSVHRVWTWSVHAFAHTSAGASKLLNLSDQGLCVSTEEAEDSEKEGPWASQWPCWTSGQECVPCQPDWPCLHRGRPGSHPPPEGLVSGDQAELLSMVGDMDSPNSAVWPLTGQRDRIPTQITLVKAIALTTTIPKRRVSIGAGGSGKFILGWEDLWKSSERGRSLSSILVNG